MMRNEKKELKDYTVSVIAYKDDAVIPRITGLINRRRFKVKSISVGDSKYPDMLRLTLVINGDARDADQIQKQVSKIVDTVDVFSIDDNNKVEREVALIKIKNDEKKSTELIRLINDYKGKIIDLNSRGIIVELVDVREKIDGFLNYLSKDSIEDLARTGIIAMNGF